MLLLFLHRYNSGMPRPQNEITILSTHSAPHITWLLGTPSGGLLGVLQSPEFLVILAIYQRSLRDSVTPANRTPYLPTSTYFWTVDGNSAWPTYQGIARMPGALLGCCW